MEESIKFNLAEQVPFNLNVAMCYPEGLFGSATSSVISWTVDNIRCDGEEALSSVHLKEVSQKLKGALEKQTLSCNIQLDCRKTYDEDEDEYQTSKSEFRLTVLGGDGSNPELLSRLKEVLGEEATYLQAEVVDWEVGRGRVRKQFKTKEMKLTWLDKMASLLDVPMWKCVDDTPNPVIGSLASTANRSSRGKLNLFLIVKDCGPSLGHKMAVYKRMLEKELASDAVILPGNGVEIKCHRGFLAAHSDVFETMFGTDMKEAKTHKIEMPDMSEEGVRAFLAYLYHWDQSKAEESCTVAVELLRAGHKYNISFLEKAMLRLLLSKPDIWYDVDVTMKLFLFVYNFDAEWDALKKKAVMLLKKNSPDLKTSPTFQELFRESPDAAMAFCQYGFSTL